jgi:tetratricopeptide (TPR) repeat protein
MLAVVRSRNAVQLLDSSGNELANLPCPEQQEIFGMTFSPDGQQLAVRCDNQVVHIWDLGRLRRELRKLGLDWDAPPFPKRSAAPGPLELDAGGKVLDPIALNQQAWRLVTGPAEQRDPQRALALAEEALELRPGDAMLLNTLGVIQYRRARYREAIGPLTNSLAAARGQFDGYNLFFLAMCHARLGDVARAKGFFARAVKWQASKKDLSPQHTAELKAFRAEAAAVLLSRGSASRR